MTKRISIWIPVFLIWSGALSAQEEMTRGVTPLKLELTLSPAPEGRESATSFTLYVLADSKRAVTLRVGREVAVPAADNRYRNVGINVTCRASTLGEGFRVDLEIERSSLVDGSDPGRPSFHTYNANSVFRLRDGQQVQLVSGPDLGEVRVKLEVVKL